MTAVGNWVLEQTNTVGTGIITLAGATPTFASFANSIPAGTVWYSIQDTNGNREAGVGNFDGDAILVRTTVQATLIGTTYNDVNPTAISLSGDATVACTFSAESYKDLLDQISNIATSADLVSYDPTGDTVSVAVNVQNALIEHANAITAVDSRVDAISIDGGYELVEEYFDFADFDLTVPHTVVTTATAALIPSVNNLDVYVSGVIQRFGTDFDLPANNSIRILNKTLGVADYILMKAAVPSLVDTTLRTELLAEGGADRVGKVGGGTVQDFIDASDTTLRTDLAASGGSDLIGIGETTLTESLTINVKQYGAVGDGVANDTTALQAAFDAIKPTGGTIRIPQGNYLFSKLTVTTLGTSTPIRVIGDGVQNTILKSNFTAAAFGEYAITVGDGTSNSGMVGLDGFTLDGALTTGEASGLKMQDNNRYSSNGEINIQQFKYGRGLELINSYLVTYGRFFIIYCFQAFKSSVCLANTFNSIQVELCGPVPAVAPPFYPAYSWLYTHSTISETDPSVVLENYGGFVSNVMIESNLAKNNLSVGAVTTVGSLYLESNFPWANEGAEVIMVGERPQILGGNFNAGAGTASPSTRCYFDLGSSHAAKVTGRIINSLSSPTSIKTGVKFGTSDRAEIDLYLEEYERGSSLGNGYIYAANYNNNRCKFNGTTYIAGFKKEELGRILLQNYSALPLDIALTDRQRGSGGTPQVVAGSESITGSSAGSDMVKYPVPYGVGMAQKIIRSSGSPILAFKVVAGTIPDDHVLYFTTWIARAPTTYAYAQYVCGAASGALYCITPAPTVNSRWERHSRVQSIPATSTTDLYFRTMVFGTAGATCYNKGAFIIDLTQFDTDHGTTLATYPIAEIDEIISADVIGQFSNKIYSHLAPTVGTWQMGDVVWESNPANTTDIPGYVCTVAGTPGTWKAMAALT